MASTGDPPTEMHPEASAEDSDRKPEDSTERPSNENAVKLDSLKALRTKYKLQITNNAKRLCNAISNNISCSNVVSDLQTSMSEFNKVHDEYCYIIECFEMDNYRNVNGMNLEEYQDAVDSTYQNAISKYAVQATELESQRIQQQVLIQTKRLENVCSNLKTLLSNTDTDFDALQMYKDEMEVMSKELQEFMSKLVEMKVSCDSLQEQITSLVLQSDDLMRQCNLKFRCSNTKSYSQGYPGLTLKSDCSEFRVVTSAEGTTDNFSKSQTVSPSDSQMSSEPVESFTKNDSSPQSHSPTYASSDDSKAEKVKTEIHLKKTSLPEFSGHRKDWPEFKAVWRELAECTIQNRSVLAYELKRSLKGQAKEKVQNIYITKPEAYDLLWKRLCEYYDDVGASVQAALDGLSRLRHVREDDFKGLVQFIDAVESMFSQLEELGQIDVLSMRDIDRITELLPNNVRMMWVRLYHGLDDSTKLKPLTPFMKFLTTERAAVARLAESSRKVSSQSNFVNKDLDKHRSDNHKISCVLHKDSKVKHSTADCREFQNLSLDEKYQSLKSVYACFNCLGLHRRDKCTSKVTCRECGKLGHHYLLCRKSGQTFVTKTKGTAAPSKDSSHTHTSSSDVVSFVASSSNSAGSPGSVSLYAIHEAFVTNTGRSATVFCDNGSNTTYITHSAADRLCAKKLDRYTLSVTTMGNIDTEYDSQLYEVSVRTTGGKIVPIQAFGMKEITGPVSTLDENCLSELFPNYDVTLLQRKSNKVDILLGCDFFGLHPKQELLRAGEHLSIMQGELGVCIQGQHPNLKENTRFSSNMVKTIHEYRLKTDCNHVHIDSHPYFSVPQLHVPQTHGPELPPTIGKRHVSSCSMFSEVDPLNFINGEELSTEMNPRCGSCKCGKCPVVGHSYSFKEEQELIMIRDNLKYDSEQQCWTTSYPWLVDPESLPNNYYVALATLRSTENTLAKDLGWAEKYKSQIRDMLDRGVARKLTEDEIQSWKGPKYYISHLAVHNPNSNSTPVRIVFNSSQLCKGVSLNSVLAKGPDNYINNLVGLLLRWREEKVAFVGDIRKMFNSVHIDLPDQHCHRFLWRDLDSTKEPAIYVMTRVNMGDRPAPAISTEALYKTAEKFHADSPAAATVLRKSSYVDDLVDSVADSSTALQLTNEVEAMLAKGGFQIKCWQYTSDGELRRSDHDTEVSLLKGTEGNTRVLGVCWDSVSDTILFHVMLNFSKKRKGKYTGPCLTANDVPGSIPEILTRRIVLQQVMSIFDPLGFLCPFTLQAKIYLRDTWSRKLAWDDALPADLRIKWIEFFTSLFQLEALKFPRCLRPENAVGQPWLVIMSDGSDLAYGFVAYIRWQLSDGSFWCRLIFAKCRIAPLNKLSTPQMELNAALLSKRGRKVIESEMRFEFERVLHIVDSETVLCMINKTSTRFKVYEGVRVGEIQAATDGKMDDWAWMSGKLNTADWLTRGRLPAELDSNSNWWNGPSVLYEPVDKWGLKFGLSKNTILPGEKKVTVMAATHTATTSLSSLIDYSRFSSFRKISWVIARILNIFRFKSFRGGNSFAITPAVLQDAENFVINDMQNTIIDDLTQATKRGGKGGKYSALKPFLDGDGLWSVGSRLSNFNPMTADSAPQRLLPYDHHVTKLLMQAAHESGHYGRNATLAKFREKYWTPNGSKLAWQAKNNCQLCKLRDGKLLEQSMGQLPESRLKPAPPFCYTMVDFFGPYLIRGEVQKRTSSKAYGVIFTDLTMRAVHIEAVFGYDTSSFLMALIRFASIRGWPSVMYSDPGTQFIAANTELKKVWSEMDKTAVIRLSTDNGLEWIMGSADSPWQQGAVESLVKAAKKAISFSVHNQRLSASEFMTLCAEVTNIINERPIGTIPSNDSDINVLTPNCMLLGRASAKNPGGWQPQSNKLSDRYHLVQKVTDHFWAKWVELCAPSLVVQRKWHTSSRNLQPGDVVLILDQNSLRGEYKLGLIKEVFPGKDGIVRKVSISYKNFKIGEKVYKYCGVGDTVVTRGVQRLALLVPIN